MERFWQAALVGVGLLLGTLLVSLHREVESRFQGELFALPARVYSRPLELAPGMDVEQAGVSERLDRLGYRRVRVGQRARAKPGAAPAAGEYVSTERWLAIGPPPVPDPARMPQSGRLILELDYDGRIERILDEGDRELERAELAPELVAELHGSYRARRRVIRLADVPPQVVDAVLVTEDQRFYQHHGIDLWRVAGAGLANLRAGRVVQGGSTITQQLIKNFYLTPERTLGRKLREIAMAIILELRHSKEEILEAYLNEIYLGQRGPIAIHGMAEAASHYFSKNLDDLDASETALLAGLIAAPGRYSPFADPDAAKARRDLVLGLLHEHEKLGDEEYQSALAEPLQVEKRAYEPFESPYFVELLRRELPREFPPERLEREGLAIYSTLDARMQRIATKAVAQGLVRLERHFSGLRRKEKPLEAALVVLDPTRGDVLALVGGRDFGRSQFDRATQAHRQPGSAFKPVVALAALSRNGGNAPAFTLVSALQDESLRMDTPEGEWAPVNFDGDFRGQVTLREAIEQSLNVPVARLGLAVGPERVVETARRLGIEGRLDPVPSLALGAFEVTPLELARAYAVLASGGQRSAIRAWTHINDAEGHELDARPAESERAFEPDETYLVTSALRGAVEHGTGRGLRRLGFAGPAAGKTGTTNGYRDAWFVGYTPELVAAVWVGFDDGKSLDLPAAAVALPIFAEFLIGALGPEGGADFAEPEGIEWTSVDRTSGRRAGPGCWGEPEIFLAGTSPLDVCVNPAFEMATRSFDWLRRRLWRDWP